MHPQFQVHRLTEEGLAQATVVALKFDELLYSLDAITGAASSREMAIVRTKLEEACFFAKKALANNPVYQQ